MQLERGEQIGAFEVEGLVGTGGMAEVWAVRHTLLGSRHALKVFFEDSPRIHREARVMTTLTHDNLLPIEELLTIGDRPALLMPLVEGPTLEALMRAHRLSRQESLALALAITEGLRAAHDAGIVHRDLKPANILIDRIDGRIVPRIMDFGLVKVDDDDIQTQAGMAMGTPAYASPEQLVDARLADARADLWSMGVILCEMLTGQRPYAGRSLQDVARRHAEPPTLSGVPPDLQGVLEALLERDLGARMASAEELLGALSLWVSGEPLAAESELAAVIGQLETAVDPGSDSMASLWTWGAGGEEEEPVTSTMAPAVTQASPPEVQGISWTERYVLERELGRGGMAVVWRAWDQRLGAWRAIKILQPQLSSIAVRRRFELEARTMARLAHRNIVTVHDIAEHSGQLFIVMEWLAGGTLSDRIKRIAPLTPRQAITVISALLDALHAAHRAGIVHRDVKPSNILLDTDGRPALTDFGIARVGSVEAGLTRTGMALGTLTYMAPEQRIDARSVDHRADLYAVGATLWTALTGRSPLLFVAPESQEELFSSVPIALAEIIQIATRYRPEDRFDDAEAMLAALRQAAELLPEDDSDTEPLVQVEAVALLPQVSEAPISNGEVTWSGEEETDLLSEVIPPPMPGLTEETPEVIDPFPPAPTATEVALPPAPPAVVPAEPPARRRVLPIAALLAGAAVLSVGAIKLLEEPTSTAPVVEEPTIEEPALTEPVEEPPVEEPPAEEPPEEPPAEESPAPVEAPARPAEDARPAAPVVEEPAAAAPVVEEPPAEEPAATGRITVRGDGEKVRLFDNSNTPYSPGEVPAGSHTLQVWFPNRQAHSETPVTVAAGQQVTISCNESFGMCAPE